MSGNNDLKDIKIVILCGGIGSRLAEETKLIPKPMVKIGKLPIISHIIKIYEHYGFRNFLLATGYKNKVLENYQINITKCLDGNYIKNFNKEEIEISKMAFKILNGCNVNEVMVVQKNTKKLGFFEKFFNLFD